MKNLERLAPLLTRSGKISLKTELLKRRIHIYDLRPKQKEMADAVDIFTTKERTITACFGGAMGGGKTYLFVMLFIELALLYPGSKWTIVRETLQRAKETVWNDVKSLAKHYVKKFGESTQAGFYAEFLNGSIIELKGENLNQDKDLDAWKSYNTNGVFIEQVEEISQEMYEMAIMRTGRWRIDPMPPALVFASVNPSPGWVKEYFYERFRKGILPRDIIYIAATIRDNPTLYNDPAYMSKFDTIDSLTRARYLDGDWNAFQAKMPWAHAFNETKHTAELEANYSEPFYISFDFNHSPVTCTIWQHYDKKIRCLTEFGTNEGISSLCEKIRNYIGWHNEELEYICYVTGDMSGWARSALIEANRTAYDIITSELNLTKYQVQAPRQNPNQLKARELTNSVLEKHPDFLIDKDHCPNLIYDLKFVEANEKHEIVKDRNKKEGKADYLDSCKYFLATYLEKFVRV